MSFGVSYGRRRLKQGLSWCGRGSRLRPPKSRQADASSNGQCCQGQTPAGADEDDVERLLLAFEELASNGLRHGGAPVRAAVTRTADGWLIDVTDAVADRVPTPAVDRDPAHGGLGLYLVARLGAAHGWWRQPDHKHVWARIRAGGAV